jgi:SAM-dependent methyltransferase
VLGARETEGADLSTAGWPAVHVPRYLSTCRILSAHIPMTLPTDHRERIYQYYVHGRQQSLAPATLAGLSSRRPYLERVVRRHFPADRSARIVDLGCGLGAQVHIAREMGYRNIIGVDRSPEQVAEARRLGIEGVELGDLMETLQKLDDDALDVVLAFDVIEHFTIPELIPFVDQVRRVLKPGGRWIIHTPNGESPFVGRIRYGDLTHEQAFTRTSLGQLLLASGFTRLTCYEDAPIVHGVSSAARRVVWQCIRAALRVYLAAETGSTDGDVILSQNLLAVAEK